MSFSIRLSQPVFRVQQLLFAFGIFRLILATGPNSPELSRLAVCLATRQSGIALPFALTILASNRLARNQSPFTRFRCSVLSFAWDRSITVSHDSLTC